MKTLYWISSHYFSSHHLKHPFNTSSEEKSLWVVSSGGKEGQIQNVLVFFGLQKLEKMMCNFLYFTFFSIMEMIFGDTLINPVSDFTCFICTCWYICSLLGCPSAVIRGVSAVTEENDSVKGKAAGGFGKCIWGCQWESQSYKTA